ncbi:hypothetical protein V6N13_029775 [Hibiscus sabdariffa]|uniref:PARP catalytic domain-containing protein n=2 Tax=Hibiscus sabdariffa TaxID=183260 RepID=A0ABR1ZMG6_9ROSI
MSQVVAEEDQVSVILDNEEISDALSGSNQIVSASNSFAHFLANGFSKLDQSCLESCIIQTSVSHNLRMVTSCTRVVAIHRNLNTSRSWQVRAHGFRLSMKAVADKCGGDANVRYAWYGAPRDEIFEIVTHGFSWSMKAHSISLSPAKHLLDSVLSSTADESGLRHLLLCRVILGKQVVVTGESSNQFHPSSLEFDSGVDSISDPTKYMVWNSRLNFSVVPCYIVSFEAPYLSGEKDYKAANDREIETNSRNPALNCLTQNVHRQVTEMAESKSLRKPVFTKVEQLRPGTSGHTLTVKVVSTKMVLQKGRTDGPQVRQMRIAECLVGDETGMIIFTARNEQVDLMKEGTTVTLRNAKIDMYKGSMRLAVDKWGRVEVDKPASFTVKEDNNLSLIEYELVNVVEE